VYYLVTGVVDPLDDCTEGGLGKNSSGQPRPHHNRCSGSAEVLTINFSTSGKHLISLPRAILGPRINDARELYRALDQATLEPLFVARHNRVTDEWDAYGGIDQPSPFGIDPLDGLAYLVGVAQTPGVLELDSFERCSSTVVLDGPGTNGSLTGRTVISLPFSSDLINAGDLMDDIDSSGLIVDLIGRFVTSTESFESYTGFAGVNFAIVPGEGYLVQVNSSTTYTPRPGGSLKAFALSTVTIAKSMLGTEFMVMFIGCVVFGLLGLLYRRLHQNTKDRTQ
jgi:hypothetical protein